MAGCLVDIQTVDASGSLVGTHTPERPPQVLCCQRCLQQRCPRVSGCCRGQIASFVAESIRHCFTKPLGFPAPPPLLWSLLRPRSGSRRRPFRHKARRSQVRPHSFITQPPHLRHLILDHKNFAVSCPLVLIGNAFYAVLVHRLMIYDLRLLPTLGCPHAVALHFAHCGQLAGGLAPPEVRPCWAHIKKPEPFPWVRVF